MLEHLADPGTHPERVVLVGRSGFVSTYLIQQLARRGVPVVAVGRPDVDLTDPVSVAALASVMRPSDAVVITAALTPDKGRDVGTLRKNLRMAEHLCDALDRSPVKHLIYVSSDAVYDGRGGVLDETASREPTDLYALMHTAREMMLGAVAQATGIPLCVLRPVAIYGPGDTHNSYGPNRFVRQALLARTISLFGDGEERRHHLFVEDAARLIADCLARRSAGTLNLLAPEVYSFMAVAQRVKAVCPHEVLIDCRPRAAGGAIVHRTYSTAPLQRAFPDFRFTPIEVALPVYVAAVADATPAGGR